MVVVVVVNVNEVLDGHIGLDIQCLDRIYLNSYVPTLQVGGQMVTFLTKHLGYRIPSPAVLGKIGTAFRRSVNSYAEVNHIPLIHFTKEDRKIDVMRRYMLAQERTGRSGVVAVGVAQEYQNVFASSEREGSNGIPRFGFHKADRRVTCFYFYLWDTDFGAGFIKVCAYFPYPIKVWVNGHEWENARPSGRPSGTPPSPTDSPHVKIPKPCRSSATGSDRAPSESSSNTVWPCCRCR